MNQSFVHVLTSMVPKWLEEIQVIRDEIICIVPSWALLPFLTFLKNHTNTQFKIIMILLQWIILHALLVLKLCTNLSIHYNARIRVKTNVDELTPIESVSSLFPSANWFERETWDMFGIYFIQSS